MSDANRTSLRFLEEASWDTLDSNPTLQTLRMTGESLVAEVENTISNELRSDRAVSDLIQTSRQNSGGFNFELSYGTFDNLLEGALFDTWATNVLKGGITEKSFSIEKAHLDIDEYFLFTGMMVNSFTLNLATSAIATGSFEFLGGTATLGQSANSTTIAAATTSSVMNCMANVASLREGSTLTNFSGVYVQELSSQSTIICGPSTPSVQTLSRPSVSENKISPVRFPLILPVTGYSTPFSLAVTRPSTSKSPMAPIPTRCCSPK